MANYVVHQSYNINNTENPTYSFSPGAANLVTLLMYGRSTATSNFTWRGVAPDYAIEIGTGYFIYFWRNTLEIAGNFNHTQASSSSQFLAMAVSFSGVETTTMDETAGGFIVSRQAAQTNTTGVVTRTLQAGADTLTSFMWAGGNILRGHTFGAGQTVIHPSPSSTSTRDFISAKTGTGEIVQTYQADGISTRSDIAVLFREGGGSVPVIDGVDNGIITPNSTPVITGTGFSATPASVLLSPTNDRTDVSAAAQNIAAGASDGTIPLEAVILPAGTVNGATLWYFVQAQDLSWSAGFSVTYSTQPTLSVPEVFTPTLDGFSFRFTTDANNGPAIWAAYATIAERNASTVASIQAEIATPDISLARGQFTVTVAGVQTVAAITGLGAAQTRWVGVFHDGDVTA